MNRIWAAFALWALGALSAQALAPARLTATPLPGESLRAGATTTLRFSADEEFGEIEEMEVLLSLDGGKTFSLRVSREMSRGTHTLTWRVPNLPSTRARLALRVGTDEEGEVIRDVSEEFTILAADDEPLEDARQFRGEWRAGDALEEIPAGPRRQPLTAPDLRGTGDSIRAFRHETDLDRARDAALAGAPPEGNPDAIEPIHPDRVSLPASPRVPLNIPRRE